MVTHLSQNDVPMTGGPASAAEDVERTEVFDGRFCITQTVNRRGFVTTLLGKDQSTDQLVVVNAVETASIPRAVLIRLRHEASVLQNLQEGTIAAVIHHGQQASRFYLVSPYIAGQSLRERLDGGKLSIREALTVGRQLLEALRAMHDCGVLHRNLDPANVIVNADAPLTKATLINCGLVHSLYLGDSIRHQPIEMARYVSPEQAGLLDLDVDQPSDLYSFGILLFECLSGRPPFDGDSVGKVLRQHLAVQPPELKSLGLAVPHALDQVLQHLLCKDPRDRYQTADAALADLNAITNALDDGIPEPHLVVGLHDRRRVLTEPAFVGRDHELDLLDEQLQLAIAGNGGLVLVEAKSGGGKTRLLAEFTRRSARHNVWVLRGNGLDQIAQRPFQVFDGVVNQLITAVNEEPWLANALSQRLGEQRDAVGAALPNLASVLGCDTTQMLGPDAHGEARNLQALSAFLGVLGSPEKPALVILDDYQWADELSVKLMSHWESSNANAERGGGHITLVVAFRSEEIPAAHPLRKLRPVAHLNLPPFGKQDLDRLAESMAGRLPAQAIELVERLSEGSPFMASAVLRGLVESGAMVAEGKGWRIEPAAMESIQSSSHAAAFLAKRIELLAPETIQLLTIAAVLGREFELGLALSLSGLSPPQAIRSFDEARQRHIVWAKPDGRHCEFVHDRLRETLLDRIPITERKSLHVRAATQLEAEVPQPIFDLAYHFGAAGEYERALPYALEAAEQAQSQHVLENAERQYLIAQRGVAPDDRATRFLITEGLGDVLMLRGKYEDAAQALADASTLADGNVAQARIQGKVGELAFKKGDMKTAVNSLENALRLLGKWIPGNSAILLVALGWEALVQGLHTLLPRLLVGRRAIENAANDLLISRLFNRLTYAYWFARGGITALWAQLRQINIAERYPPTAELAQAYSTHAPLMSAIGFYKRGIAYAKRSNELWKQRGDLWGQGQSLHFCGVVLYTASQFEECIEKCRQAIRLLERTGDLWEVNIARYQLAASYYRLGDLRAAADVARQMHESGKELGDAQAAGISLDVWAPASRGNIPADAAEQAVAGLEHDAQGTAQTLLGEGIRLLWGADDAEAAVEIFERARERARKGGVRNTYVTPLHSWLATALRECAKRNEFITPARRKRLLRRAAAAARWGRLYALVFQNDRPHALRESALLAARQGRVRRARRLICKSLAVADRQHARFEHAQSQVVFAKLAAELDWPQAAELGEAAQKEWREFQELVPTAEPTPSEADAVPITLSLADRFDSLLEVGRQIATGLSRDAIFSSVREAALRLLRSERCLLLNVQLSGDALQIEGEVGDADKGLSHHLVHLARQAGRALAATAETSDELADKFTQAGVRSALCAPIYARDKLTACLYVTHRQIAGLFGEDEERLADFVATIAGAALENAMGFAELKELNATLEQRVAERTAHIESQNRLLEAKQAELKRSNEELEQFAYVASHDLQEPLRTVTSYCQLLLRRHRDKLDGEAQEFMQFAIDGAARMKQLITDLLAYSRTGTHGKPFARTELSQVLNTVLGSLRFAIEDAKAEITFDPLPEVMADATQISQLLQNLINNALKFRGERAPRIHVGAKPQDGHWLLSVRDNGIGMESQHFDRIFQIFQRLHNREQYSGTGIGLAVCKKTVERHGGKIWVESEVDKGSTFLFTIPSLPTSISSQPS